MDMLARVDWISRAAISATCSTDWYSSAPLRSNRFSVWVISLLALYTAIKSIDAQFYKKQHVSNRDIAVEISVEIS
jgi:hypothetical protein